jgi:hypothetical protein
MAKVYDGTTLLRILVQLACMNYSGSFSGTETHYPMYCQAAVKSRIEQCSMSRLAGTSRAWRERLEYPCSSLKK